METRRAIQEVVSEVERQAADNLGTYMETFKINEKGAYHSFFEDWDGDKIRFYYLLKGKGWQTISYEAPYLWKLSKDGYYLEYVEGDVYIYEIKKE